MKLRVLHLEDDPGDVELIRSALARDGLDCDILAVRSGDAYLAALQGSQFDLILSDSGVPGYNGEAAATAAREQQPDVPFIVVSGRPDPDNERVRTRRTGRNFAPKSNLDLLGSAVRRTVFAQLEGRLAAKEAELRRRSAELEVLNREMESFSHAAAHDLRSPLITIDGFSQVLLETCSAKLDDLERDHLARISAAVRQMHRRLNDLLALSKVVHAPLEPGRVDLSQLAAEIIAGLKQGDPDRNVAVSIAEGLIARGDVALLKIALGHLLSNAWKFTSRRERATIEIGMSPDGRAGSAYFVRDDGEGFDPRCVSRLFSPFQRLHAQSQFPGSGVGLAAVQRIVHRHGGKIWAESDGKQGACFFFTLPD